MNSWSAYSHIRLQISTENVVYIYHDILEIFDAFNTGMSS
jgi:hypothetical protein